MVGMEIFLAAAGNADNPQSTLEVACYQVKNIGG
jgi:hypothetical protein